MTRPIAQEQYIAPELSNVFSDEDLFSQVDALSGEVFRQVASRRTIKVRLEDRDYFAKIHHGVGWGEILKNLFQGRLPILGARNEWQAIRRLESVGVSTMSASLYCQEGIDPARRRSAILTRSLEDKISLEDFETGDPVFKRRLIAAVARMARVMHEAGVNHRDFYLCHFLMDEPAGEEPVLHLIDLHRAQLRDRVPRRWLEKDLGGLLFSAFDKGLTRRDLLRFIRIYGGCSLREALSKNPGLCRGALQRAKALYLQDHDGLPGEVERLLAI